MTDPPYQIRRATPADADDVAAMCHALSRDEDSNATNHFSAAHFLRDGFGPRPAFTCLLAMIQDRAVGYAMHCPDYDTDRLCRSVYLSDLYVEKAARKRGIGRALMAAVAHEGRSRGARIMMWGVLRHNDLARDFYRTIGEEQPKLIGTFIGGPELSQLAAWNSTATDISVRSAVAGDSALLAAWLRALLADIDEPPPPEDAESRIRADGFGRDPAFTALIAERAAVPLGYTLYWPTYDTETAGRGLWLSDLYVVPGARRSNVGRILMAALARRAVAGDASFINFLVLERNQRARAFYRTIAREWHEGYTCLCDGERFDALADEAPAIA